MAETCNVRSNGIVLESIFDNSLKELETEVKLTLFAGFEDSDSVVIVNGEQTPQVSGGVFFKEKQRVSDGFRATFSFQIAGGGDGIAFVIQNQGIDDLTGGGGENLGFKGSFDRSLGIGIDTCAGRVEDGDCETETLQVFTQDINGQIAQVNETISLRDKVEFTIKNSPQICVIEYLEDSKELLVFLNGIEAFRDTLDPPLQPLLGDEKDAFIGFTSSTGLGEVEEAVITVERFKFEPMNSLSRLSDESLEPQTINVGDAINFQVLSVDTCNVAGRFNATDLQNRVEGRLISSGSDGEQVILEQQTVSLAEDGSIAIGFVTPLQNDTWDLEIRIDGVLTQNNPVRNILTTEIPDAGLQPLGIGLLVSLMVVLMIGVVYMVNRLNRYRRKLNEHQEDIEFGKTKKVVDAIEKKVTYSTNPMVASLDELKERLARNQKKIEDLKRGRENAVDSQNLLQQLQTENNMLRQDINRVRREKEINDAGNRISTNLGARFFGRGKAKQGFSQEES